jgi:hypothetical protein
MIFSAFSSHCEKLIEFNSRTDFQFAKDPAIEGLEASGSSRQHRHQYEIAFSVDLLHLLHPMRGREIENQRPTPGLLLEANHSGENRTK